MNSWPHALSVQDMGRTGPRAAQVIGSDCLYTSEHSNDPE
jgi:hypothetical protein